MQEVACVRIVLLEPVKSSFRGNINNVYGKNKMQKGMGIQFSGCRVPT